MYCEKCGKENNDKASSCTCCGTHLRSSPSDGQSVYKTMPSVSLTVKDPASSAMVWGLVSLLTSGFLIPGIVFACIGLEKVIKAAKIGAYNGMAKAGKVLSIIALFISGISVAFWIYIIWVIYAFSSVPDGFVF